MFNVVDIMTTELHTLTPDDSMRDARKLMAEHNIRHIPIVEGNQRLVGLLSQRDVLAAADSSLLAHADEADSVESHIAVSSVMTKDPATIDEHASLRGAALYLQKHRIGCLPVVKDRALVGIITDSDFVAIAINLMEQIESTEPEDQDYLDEIA
jgi:CBS domain-containing membrane protein